MLGAKLQWHYRIAPERGYRSCQIGLDVTVNDGRVFQLGEWVATGGILYSPRPREVEMVKGKIWDS